MRINLVLLKEFVDSHPVPPDFDYYISYGPFSELKLS
jgi:hypothetical protein